MVGLSRALRISCLAAFAALVAACGDDPVVGSGAGDGPDVASPDVVTADAATPDAGQPDAGQPDAGPADVWVGPDTVSTGPIGGDRPAQVYLPAAYDPASAWPLVIVLHGFSADGWAQDIYFQTSELRDEVGAIVVVPDGTKNPTGQHFWNATPACCDFAGSGVDDAGYLLGLIAEARTLWHVDRVVLVGHSNGGFMAHRLACDAADQITAIASLAGSMRASADDCQPSEPVGVLQIHGTLDTTIPYLGTFGYPGAEETASRWAANNGCAAGPEAGAAADYDLIVLGPETTSQVWSDCADGVGVALWTMNASAHIPTPDQPDFGRAILGWLLAQPK